MADHARATSQRVLERLRVVGVASARDLGGSISASQPAISRALSQLGQRVVRIGRGRSTRYAPARSVGRFGSRWPIHQIAADSRVTTFGTLQALDGGNWLLDPAEPRPGWLDGEFRDGLFPGLPWFLDDLRPQGFMGRAFARQCAADLGVNEDATRWSADEVLIALLLRGEDLLGNFVLGDVALERAQRIMLAEPEAIGREDRAGRYATLAQGALAGDVVGSSAGGEQPKFTATVAGDDGSIRHVIVKFSDVRSTPGGRRWADLLMSEHLAARILARHGVPAASTEVVAAGDRHCLEVTRFDRVGAHGRVGFVSLQPLDAADYGALDRWVDAADRLERDRWLTREDADRLRLLWWFGGLIANADMHFANAGLFLTGERPCSLAPSYDMLPMLYRPGASGEIVAREFRPPLPPPAAVELWRSAAAMAEDLWRTVESTEEISRAFRDIAGANAEQVAALRVRY